MDLPLELQIKVLLKLEPEEILSYCLTCKQSNEIWSSDSFWNAKSLHDMEYSMNVFFEQSPYHKYRTTKFMFGDPILWAPLFRTGKLEMAQRYRELYILKDLAIDMIFLDDLTALKFLLPVGSVIEKRHIAMALMHQSIPPIRYIMSLVVPFTSDQKLQILSEVFADIRHIEESLVLLDPYLCDLIQADPIIIRRLELLGHDDLALYMRGLD